MEQQRLNAYLNLIQKLLTCPQGEEWIHLKRQEQLVDAQFVQVMEQVAAQLARQGDRKTATFLHNWAAKLHHILVKESQPPSPEEDKSQAYLDLIQQLLACPRGMEEQILAAHQALIGPTLVHKMHEVAQQLKRGGEAESAQFLEELATQLNQAWLQAHNFQANLQKAPVNRESTATSAPPIADIADPWAEPQTTASASPLSAPPHPPQPPIPESDAPQPSSTAKVAGPTAAAPPLDQAGHQAIADGLNAIAQALQQLNQTLKAPRSPHPLWYLDVLEQACAVNWQLTTEEIEQLIGVKPKCHGGETVYQRGNWRFTKVGKLGGQTAWQVSKGNNGRDSET